MLEYTHKSLRSLILFRNIGRKYCQSGWNMASIRSERNSADDNSNIAPVQHLIGENTADNKSNNSGNNTTIINTIASSSVTENKSNNSRNNTFTNQSVLVTGGSGFLGRHMVSVLRSHAPEVKDICVLDPRPFNPLSGLSDENPECVTYFQGSITDPVTLRKAMEGVHSVYHIAGKISFGTFPDFIEMNRINIQGTEEVIKACLEKDVPRLIFCSTVDVAIGYHDIINGCEVTTAVPPIKFLFPGYPESKHRAECIVLGANGQKTKNCGTLRTLSLRANVMYGEGDPYYITSGLRNAEGSNGTLYRVGTMAAKFQPVYAGNTAWAFICADRALARNPSLGGQFYYIPDDTPIQSTFNFIKPFLEIRGFKLSTFSLPYGLVYYGLLCLEWIAKLLSPIYKIALPAESYSIRYINMDLYFSREKATRELGFKPIFFPKDAIARCLSYYRDVKL